MKIDFFVPKTNLLKLETPDEFTLRKKRDNLIKIICEAIKNALTKK